MNTMHWRILVLCVGIWTTLSFSCKVPCEIIVVKPYCNSEAILPCPVKSYVNAYTSIIWYKVNASDKEGIIVRKENSTPTPYAKYANVASLTTEDSLVLRNITFKHAETFKCQINPRVGGIIQCCEIVLNSAECVNKTTPSTPVFSTLVSNLMHSATQGKNSSMINVIHPVEVTTLWAFVSFITIGLTKVLLCVLCVWAVVAYKKHRRRKIWS
ncbi:hypothetical protein NFI96_029039 [Prochilodus magdalenae]|nr:hypothetical protein NFI96_029039 [Prochilodus magdalenae]